MSLAVLDGRASRRASASADRIIDRAPAHVQPTFVQAASASPSNQDVQAVLARSSGQPLDRTSRAFFEPRFQQDFSRVRVHADPVASAASRALGARAFTVGQDIAFAPGQYAPHTCEGQRLLAHELVHTVQQADTGAPRIDRSVGEFGLMLISGLDLGPIAAIIAPIAIREATAYAPAGHDYGPQNALRHCLLAALLDTWGWRAAIAEMAAGVAIAVLTEHLIAAGLFFAYGALLAARVRLFLMAHEWFGDDGCGNTGTSTVDSRCDRYNNDVGLAIGGPLMSNTRVISESKAALDGGRLLMAPGPTDLRRTTDTARWRTSPWMVPVPVAYPDCDCTRPGTLPPKCK